MKVCLVLVALSAVGESRLLADRQASLVTNEQSIGAQISSGLVRGSSGLGGKNVFHRKPRQDKPSISDGVIMAVLMADKEARRNIQSGRSNVICPESKEQCFDPSSEASLSYKRNWCSSYSQDCKTPRKKYFGSEWSLQSACKVSFWGGSNCGDFGQLTHTLFMYYGHKNKIFDKGKCQKKHGGLVHAVRSLVSGKNPVCTKGKDHCESVKGPNACTGTCVCDGSLNKCECVNGVNGKHCAASLGENECKAQGCVYLGDKVDSIGSVNQFKAGCRDPSSFSTIPKGNVIEACSCLGDHCYTIIRTGKTKYPKGKYTKDYLGEKAVCHTPAEDDVVLDSWWPYVGTYAFVSDERGEEGSAGWYYSSYQIRETGDNLGKGGYSEATLDETFKCIDKAGEPEFKKSVLHGLHGSPTQAEDQQFVNTYFGQPRQGWKRVASEYDAHVKRTQRKWDKAVKESGAKSWADATMSQRRNINKRMGNKFLMSIMNLGKDVTPHYTVYTGNNLQVHSSGR